MIFCLRDSERRSRQVAGKKEKMRERLIGLSDPEYKEFNDRILNAPSVKTLGIRVPVLRKLAKETAKEMQKEDGWLYEMTRTKGEGIYQEEHMLFGMVAGYRKASREERVQYLDAWVPGICSWADCDCCVSTFGWMEEDPDFWFSYLQKWVTSNREFEVRFGVISMMDYFLKDLYIDRVLKIYEEIGQKEYYVRMGIAWSLATAYLKYPDKIIDLLKGHRMDVWTHNKAIQKCRESRRVSAEDKAMLQKLETKAGGIRMREQAGFDMILLDLDGTLIDSEKGIRQFRHLRPGKVWNRKRAGRTSSVYRAAAGSFFPGIHGIRRGGSCSGCILLPGKFRCQRSL